jgi:bifunctional DNA-binding transcriptional regulator/antitoxin component of YhaV-PrlF toxin-antitoxin module
MKLNSKGQVTIPAELRHRHGLAPVPHDDSRREQQVYA